MKILLVSSLSVYVKHKENASIVFSIAQHICFQFLYDRLPPARFPQVNAWISLDLTQDLERLQWRCCLGCCVHIWRLNWERSLLDFLVELIPWGGSVIKDARFFLAVDWSLPEVLKNMNSPFNSSSQQSRACQQGNLTQWKTSTEEQPIIFTTVCEI